MKPRKVKVIITFVDSNELGTYSHSYIEDFKHDLINILIGFDEVYVEEIKCEEIK